MEGAFESFEYVESSSPVEVVALMTILKPIVFNKISHYIENLLCYNHLEHAVQLN